MASNYKIPFDEDGNQATCAEGAHTWKDNYEFEASLILETYHRGQSSVSMEFKDEKGVVYWVSLHEFMRLVPEYTILKGRTPKLWWTFRKVGGVYYLYEVQPDPEWKRIIDGMSQKDMAYAHRFTPCGDSMFQNATGTYFAKVFQDKGGMTTAVSKEIGWGGDQVESSAWKPGQCVAVLGSDGTGEYRCGKEATHRTVTGFWTTGGMDVNTITMGERRCQYVCEKHAEQVDAYHKKSEEVCIPLKFEIPESEG